MIKKILTVFLCLILCVSICPVISATITPTIIISNVSDVPGNKVTVDISITNNPGIMAMTFSVPYDNTRLEFVEYSKGYVSSPTVKDHSDKGYVVFSILETKDKSNSGTILSLTFKIKNNAKPGTCNISIANHYYEKNGKKLDNCFANATQDYIVPTVKAGSIVVEETCENAGHQYSGWKILTEKTCENPGEKERSCLRCGETEKASIPAAHDFEFEWTVDKAATPEEDGLMSRHCKKCSAVTDEIIFSYEEIGDDSDDETSSAETSDTETSSDENTDNESLDSTGENVSSEDTSNQIEINTDTGSSAISKPSINNTVGSKVPLSEVEKLENYDPNDSKVSEIESSEDTTSTKDDTTTTGDAHDSQNNDPQKPNTTSIIVSILSALLSVGIIALAIKVIINKRNEQTALEQEMEQEINNTENIE